MMKRMVTSLYPFFYRLFMTLLLLVIAVGMAGYRLGLPRPTLIHGLMALWVAVLLSITSMGKLYQKMLSIAVLAVSTLIMVPLIKMAGIITFYENYVLWMGGNAGYQEEWILGYELIQIVWMTLACYIIHFIFEKILILEIGTAVLFFVGLLVGMFFGQKGSQPGMAAAVTFILIAYADFRRRIRGTKKRHDKKAYFLFLTPFILLYFVIMSIVPIRDVPYDWKVVKDTYKTIKETTITLWESIVRNGEDFNGLTTGFSDTPWVGEQRTRFERQVMTVIGDRNLITDVYLRGKTYDTFDDCHWQETLEQKADEYPIDILELVYGVKRYDSDWENNYTKRANLKIRYEHFNTAYAFAPDKLQGVLNKEYIEAGDVMRFYKEEGYGTEYEVSYYQMNYGVPEFNIFAESVGDLPDEKDTFENSIMILPLEQKTPYTLEDLAEYRAAMHDQYCQEITLSPKVQQFIDKATEGCTTQWQRLKAIEKALLSMEYTATPGNIPKSVKSAEEYLDYFLLESRKGYCAHYATAFVLLARAEGLPARYVEGFRAPYNESKNIRVYNSTSHAWPEVYWEGLGWVRFEPTPEIADYAYSGWLVQKGDQSTVEVREPVRLDPSDSAAAEDAQAYLEELSRQEEAAKRRLRMMIIGGVLSVLGICLIVFLTKLFISKLRYRKKNDAEKFLVEVKKNLWLLEKLGFKRGPSETLDELEDRIGREAPRFTGGTKKLAFIRGYQECIYRSMAIEKEMLQTALAERKRILECLKGEKRWYYFVITISLMLRMDK